MIYGFLNILVGVFVDGTLESAREQEEKIARHRELVSNNTILELKNLWLRIDESGDGSLTKEEFVTSLHDPVAMEIIEALDLGEVEVGELLDTLDEDNNGTLGVGELVC